MWHSLPSLILSLLTTLPLALSAPADTPATTTLLSVTPTLPPKFPPETPYSNAYPSVHRCGDDENDGRPWRIASLHSEPSQMLTEFVPAPTGPDGKVQRWYIVTYWSCVTFSNDYVHCGYHTPVRPGVGPDGCSFDGGGRKKVWIAGVVLGVVVAVVGAIVM